MKRIRIQTENFDLAQEDMLVRQNNPAIGAVVSFSGIMRDINQGDKVKHMTLEHYPGMTEKSLNKIADEASKRWELQAVTIIHRVGDMLPKDQIVLVITASQHRQAAFDSCAFIMDYLKTQAPFWKKEVTHKGERWVDARDSDQNALKKWKNAPDPV